MRKEYVAVMEAAYRTDQDERDWLRGILEAARPTLDHGFGMTATTFELDHAGLVQNFESLALGRPTDGVDLLPVMMARTGRDAESMAATRSIVAVTLSDLPSRSAAIDAGLALSAARGIPDWFALQAADPSGRGCVISVPLSATTTLTAEESNAWARIAAHITAGRRLINPSTRVPAAAHEAVLSPAGKVLHAEGPATHASARDALREAARNIDRARSSMRRRDPEGAVEIWEGLVAGRWSLVDQFDTDGRRYLVARRNDPAVRGPSALTERERQVVGYAALGHSGKLIAYELGLAQSTVATHLTSAARKLGVHSRVELVQLARSLPSGASATSDTPTGT